MSPCEIAALIAASISALSLTLAWHLKRQQAPSEPAPTTTGDLQPA